MSKPKMKKIRIPVGIDHTGNYVAFMAKCQEATAEGINEKTVIEQFNEATSGLKNPTVHIVEVEFPIPAAVASVVKGKVKK